MVHFHNLDSLQHRLWPYLDVDETGIHDPGWNEEVAACMAALDESVGRLLELASKRDAAVIAVSDHGFGPCRALVNVNGLLRAAGLQRGLMYGTRFRYRAERLGDRLHRWLTRTAPGGPGRRLPRSIEGQVGCDWKRTWRVRPVRPAQRLHLPEPAGPCRRHECPFRRRGRTRDRRRDRRLPLGEGP